MRRCHQGRLIWCPIMLHPSYNYYTTERICALLCQQVRYCTGSLDLLSLFRMLVIALTNQGLQIMFFQFAKPALKHSC